MGAYVYVRAHISARNIRASLTKTRALHTASTHMCVEANKHVCLLYIPFVDSMPHLPNLFDFTLLFQPLKQVIRLGQAQAAEI